MAHLEFVVKVPKVASDSEVILLKDKTAKNKLVKSLIKSLFNNKLFLERKIVTQNIMNTCLFALFTLVHFAPFQVAKP